MRTNLVNTLMATLFVGAVAAPAHAGQPPAHVVANAQAHNLQAKSMHVGVQRQAPRRQH